MIDCHCTFESWLSRIRLNMSQLVTIHTGNVLQLSELRRRPGQTPADEVNYTFIQQICSDSFMFSLFCSCMKA